MAQDNIPSLSELYSYRPNAELAQGDRDVVPDDRQAIQYLLQGARDNIAIQQNKYNQFQKNFQENFDKFKFDYDGIAPQHRKELQENAAEFFKKLGKDPSVLANPASNPAAYADIMNSHEQLNSKIAKSKSINKYTAANEKYMYDNPELLNEGNKKLIQDTLNTPIDQWEAFNLKLPTAIDFQTLANAGIKQSMSDEKWDEAITEFKRDASGNPIPMKDKNGKPIIDPATNQPKFETYYTGKRRSGIVKAPIEKNYMNFGDALYESNKDINKYGVKIQDAVRDTFNALPETQKDDINKAAKAKGEDPMKFFFKTSWSKFYNPTKDLSNLKETDDKAYLEELEQQNKLELEREKGKQDRQGMYLSSSLTNKPLEQQSDAILRITGSMLGNTQNNSDGKPRQIAVLDAVTNKYTDFEYLKPNEETLKAFGKSEKVTSKVSTKDGEEETTTTTSKRDPDALARRADGSLAALYYVRKDGNIQYQNGNKSKPILENSQVYSPAEVLAIVAKANKLKPEAVSLAEKIIQKDYKGSIINYANARTQGQNIAAEDEQPKVQTTEKKVVSLRNKYKY